MKRLLGLTAIFLVLPVLLFGQESKLKKVMVFPFQVSGLRVQDTYGRELAGLLGGELAKEGDLEIIPSTGGLADITEGSRIDALRMARIAARNNFDAVVWGTVSKLEDGLSLSVSVSGKNEREKPRQFSVEGKDRADLNLRLKDLALELGTVVFKRPLIRDIKLEGNHRIQKDAILNKLTVRPGKPFYKSILGDEIKHLYAMGYFEDVQVKADQTPSGEIDLHIILKERPSIKSIEITGNKVLTNNQILDAITTKSYAVASTEKIHEDINILKKLYEKQGYYQPKIDYELKELSRNEATLQFKIEEGPKNYLTEVVLDGRDKISDKELQSVLLVKPKGWLWFIDESGSFTSEKLEQSRMLLLRKYMAEGFIQAQVAPPKIDLEKDHVKVTYPIREGQRFQVRKVSVEGDLVVPQDKLQEVLKLKPRTWFNRDLAMEDIKELTKLYNNLGYAYADVEFKPLINDQHHFVDVAYKISKGERVHVDRVEIVGNQRTRDKVIRRNVVMGEGELYNADKLDATKKSLESMEFFEAVRLKTAPSSRPDLMNLTVEVMEKKTGSVVAGLGFSSQEGAMGNVNIKEMNLFGLGILANVKSNISGRTTNYEGSLTYPWLFDIPLTASLQGTKAIQKETHYLREGEGFSASLGYPLYWGWGVSGSFSRQSTRYSGFARPFGRSVAEYYQSYGATAQKFMSFAENSLSVNLAKDTRNSSFLPSGGSRITLSGRFAGLGADVSYNRYSAEGIYYQALPIVPGLVVKLRTQAAMLQEVGSDPIPFDRRILLGGMGTIRGYQYGDIGPRDRYGNIMGGDRSLIGSVECMFHLPFGLSEKLKMNGVVFGDAGNAWNASKSPFLTDIKGGVGAGVRWISPMGPLRLEYGWKVQPLPGEERGAFGMSMGQLF
ncbi:MAG: outer membrane protein assembly factor BamA [Desulfomonile tiedjei]|nr:outer membrane protein assembly factor BamA [Desulfomonile tiedjei]